LAPGEPVFIEGRLQPSRAPAGYFRAASPLSGEPIGPDFPVSTADEPERAVRAGARVAAELEAVRPEILAGFFDACAGRAETRRPSSGRRRGLHRMPTGVAVSPAMNHGGPFPATGHPGFTAVGIPASLLRFAALRCYDGVRPDRLPPELQDRNPNGRMWRWIDGEWTRRDVKAPRGKE